MSAQEDILRLEVWLAGNSVWQEIEKPPAELGQIIEKNVLSLLERDDTRYSTIDWVLKRENFLEYLNSLWTSEIISYLLDSNITPEDKIRKVNMLCMGVWLELCSTLAIDEEWNIHVNINPEDWSIQVSEWFMDGLSGIFASEEGWSIAPVFFEQALLRQVERYFVFETNWLLVKKEGVQRILTIWWGTQIESVMLREIYQGSEIHGYEPGLISQKTRSIAGIKNLKLIESLESSEEKYDIILLHFVLEHDREQAINIIKDALRKLAPWWRISIAIPNYDSFHRAEEVRLNRNRRDPKTRLSLHDNLSWHQIIHTIGSIEEIIHQAMEESGINLPYNTHTILPRYMAFNSLISAATQLRKRLEIDTNSARDSRLHTPLFAGNLLAKIQTSSIPDTWNWSVICITIWSSDNHPDDWIYQGEVDTRIFDLASHLNFWAQWVQLSENQRELLKGVLTSLRSHLIK